MRYLLVALSLLVGSVRSAGAQVSVGIGFPGVDIGIHVGAFPELVVVPGYPVYYDPRAEWNYFFYDGAYWVYEGDNWYASSWYDGPWHLVRPEHVPLFLLRVPVRYYRRPPPYFHAWRPDAPPRWGEHWGHGWERRRAGWDRWDRRAVPRPAPLPVYQRQYSGDRYPRPEEQHAIRAGNYRYRPREAVTREHYRGAYPGGPRPEPQRQAPVPQQRQDRERMHRPEPRGPDRESRNEERGRMRGPEPRDDRRDGRDEGRGREHRPGPRGDGRENGDDERGRGRR